jgi:hypothetical protein
LIHPTASIIAEAIQFLTRSSFFLDYGLFRRIYKCLSGVILDVSNGHVLFTALQQNPEVFYSSAPVRASPRSYLLRTPRPFHYNRTKLTPIQPL